MNTKIRESEGEKWGKEEENHRHVKNRKSKKKQRHTYTFAETPRNLPQRDPRKEAGKKETGVSLKEKQQHHRTPSTHHLL